jgi:hypothetical protein
MGIQYPPHTSVIPICFASCSIGFKSGAALPEKLRAIHGAGFDAFELAMSDLLEYGFLLNGEELDPTNYDDIAEVSKSIRSLAENIGIKILVLKPLPTHEGPNHAAQKDGEKGAFTETPGWLKVMEALGAEMIQVSTSPLLLSIRLNSRSWDHRMSKRSLVAPTILLQVWFSLQTCVLRKASVWHTRTSAGQNENPRGKKLGRL